MSYPNRQGTPIDPATSPFRADRPIDATDPSDSKKATEYGGVEGLIQPPPHDSLESGWEQLLRIYNTDPAPRVAEEVLPGVEATAVKEGTPNPVQLYPGEQISP